MKKQLKRHIKVKTIFSSKGCLQKKKTPYGGTLSQPHITPSPPSKVGTNIEGTFFGLWTPLPPFKSREIC